MELRIFADNIDSEIFYVLLMNEKKRFNLTRMSNQLIWTLPVLQNETINIAIEAKRLNTSELLFVTNYVVVQRPTLEDSFDSINMFDEHRITQIVDRTILLKPNFVVSVEADKNSQLMEFETARYFDSIDRLDTKISIIYVNPIGEEYIFEVLNVSTTDDKIRFNWLLEDTVSVVDGNVSFKIQFSNNNYLWQTLSCEFKVMPTLDADSIIAEIFPTKIQAIQSDISKLENRTTDLEEKIIIINKDSYLEFPNIGNENNLYIDKNTDKIYRWDNISLKYYTLGTDFDDIKVIRGGDSTF